MLAVAYPRGRGYVNRWWHFDRQRRLQYDSGFRAKRRGLGFRGLGFRGLGFRIWGLGFR